MFVLYSKLKLLKSKLKAFNIREFSNLPERVKETKRRLEDIQRAILGRQGESELTPQEHAASTNYYLLAGLEKNFLRQKLRNKWLQLGDHNTSYFFDSLKMRHHQNTISTLALDDGTVTTNNRHIKEEIVTYFQNLFMAKAIDSEPNHELISSAISSRISVE